MDDAVEAHVACDGRGAALRAGLPTLRARGTLATVPPRDDRAADDVARAEARAEKEVSLGGEEKGEETDEEKEASEGRNDGHRLRLAPTTAQP